MNQGNKFVLNMEIEELVLVDENDHEIGTEEKLKTHLEGKLHRAFSIFIFDDSQRLLLQKRAETKYHSGGLWSNTCCGHPRPGELTIEAAHRRLQEEMNFDCNLHKFFTFQYRAEMENNLIENEVDHVFIGKFYGVPFPNAEEVQAWKWIDLVDLKDNLEKHPENYSYWLRKAFEKNEWNSLNDSINSL